MVRVCGKNETAVFRTITECLNADSFPLVHDVAVQILQIGISENQNVATSLHTYAGIKVSFCSSSNELFPIFVPTTACQTVILTTVHFDPKFTGLITNSSCSVTRAGVNKSKTNLYIPNPEIRAVLWSTGQDVRVVRTPGDEINTKIVSVKNVLLLQVQ